MHFQELILALDIPVFLWSFYHEMGILYYNLVLAGRLNPESGPVCSPRAVVGWTDRGATLTPTFPM